MTMSTKRQTSSGGVYEAPSATVILLQEQQVICASLNDELPGIPEEGAGIDDWSILL